MNVSESVGWVCKKLYRIWWKMCALLGHKEFTLHFAIESMLCASFFFFSQEIPTDMRCVKMMHCKDLRSRKEQREAAGMSFSVLSQQRETLWGKKRCLKWTELFYGKNPLFNVVLNACNLCNIIVLHPEMHPLSTNLNFSRSFSEDNAAPSVQFASTSQILKDTPNLGLNFSKIRTRVPGAVFCRCFFFWMAGILQQTYSSWTCRR